MLGSIGLRQEPQRAELIYPITDDGILKVHL